jgi:DNA-binding response OmpR family regulator
MMLATPVSPSIILVVDDEPLITKTLVLVLNKASQDFLAIGCTCVSEALATVRGVRPDLVILDVIMPGARGLEHALEMREKCGCKMLLMSGETATTSIIEETVKAGNEPFEIVAKPIHPTQLIEKVRKMLVASPHPSEWKNPLRFHVQ